MQGGSPGYSLPIDYYRARHNEYPAVDSSKSLLNAAISGSGIDSIIDQIGYLKNLTTNTFQNQSNSWKFISILIGANDACGACASHPGNDANVTYWTSVLNQNIQALYEVRNYLKIFITYTLF